MNCDGAFDLKPCKAGIGVVARNSEGKMVARLAKAVKGIDAGKMKAFALREGIRLALKEKFQKIIMESDLEIMINAILKDRGYQHWKFVAVVHDIKGLLIQIKEAKWRNGTSVELMIYCLNC